MLILIILNAVMLIVANVVAPFQYCCRVKESISFQQIKTFTEFLLMLKKLLYSCAKVFGEAKVSKGRHNT